MIQNYIEKTKVGDDTYTLFIVILSLDYGQIRSTKIRS